MNIEVRFFSRGGHTKKVAEAIAEAAGVAPEAITVPFSKPVDLLFLGGGIYAGKPASEVLEYAKALSGGNVKRVAFFSTSMSPTNGFAAQVEENIANDIEVIEPAFHCPGQFLFFNRKRPKEEDLSKAKDFAAKTIHKLHPPT